MSAKDDSDTECMSEDHDFWSLFSPIQFAYCSLLFLLLSYLNYRFMKHLQRNPPRPKCMWFPIITFCISQQLTLLAVMIASAFCWLHLMSSAQSALNYLLISTSVISLYFLLIIFFMRFTLVLQCTMHKVSKYALLAYYTLFTITAICYISAVVLYSPLGLKVVYLLATIGSCGLLIMAVFLILTFISKLIVVYKTTDKDEEIVSIITKLVLLLIMFTAFGILSFVLGALRVYMKSLLTMTLFMLLFLFDVVIKSLCLILSYDAFERVYKCICKYPDQQCGRMFVSKIEEQMMVQTLEIQAKTDPDSASTENQQTKEVS